MPRHKTWVEVSKRALLANYEAMRALVAPTQVMAVVKANAYGHGLVEVASALQDAQVPWFGVDWADEALTLRANGISAKILVLGYTPAERMKELVDAEISFVVYTQAMLEAASAAGNAAGKRARIHLKVETGLHRQGIGLTEFEAFVDRALMLTHVEIEGISTHYANIEDTEDASYATQQLKAFQRANSILRRKTEGRPLVAHTACSAAAALFPETRFDVVREGIMLYGLWSSERTERAAKRAHLDLALEPVLTWKTIVAQVKPVKAGEPVSYGLTERMVRDGSIAVLPIGYADGFDRVGMSGKGTVLIRGQRCKVIGRVCMNMCMVDVSHVEGAEEGDEVVLLGTQGNNQITAEELAAQCETIAYEIVARINPLFPRTIM